MQRDLVSRLLRRLTAPDVKRAFEEAQAKTPSADAPVFDPSKITPQPRVPTPWQTPSTNDPSGIFR